MKRFFALLMILAIVVSGWLIYWRQTNSPQATASKFLSHLQHGEIDAAYELTTSELRIGASQSTLEQRARQLDLASITSSNWDDVEPKGSGIAVVKCQATLESSEKLDLEMQLVHEFGDWRVDYLTKTRGDIQLPAEGDIEQLVSGTLVDLSTAMLDDKFDEFRANCAKALQVLNSREELEASFLAIDYTFAKEMRPNFSQPPAIDDEGHLQLLGYFPTQPTRLDYVMKFTYEGNRWRLLAVQIHLVDAFEQQAREFVALLGEDKYSAAYQMTSDEFRAQTSQGQFDSVIGSWSIRDNAAVHWQKAEAADDIVRLHGDIKTTNGPNRQIEVGMILEKAKWKVHYLR